LSCRIVSTFSRSRCNRGIATGKLADERDRAGGFGVRGLTGSLIFTQGAINRSYAASTIFSLAACPMPMLLG
jgi:hypothetical protein